MKLVLILESTLKILKHNFKQCPMKNWKEENYHFNPANFIELLYVSPSQLKIVNVYDNSLMCTGVSV